MIVGIGVDIVEIKSFHDIIKNNAGFCRKVFTKNEIEYCESYLDKYLHYSARFCVKESMMKALNVGWNNGVHWKDIETIRYGQNAPYVQVHNKVKALLEEKKVTNIHLSISHSDFYSTSIVILESI